MNLERPSCNYIEQDCVCMFVTDIEEFDKGDDCQHLRVFGITDRENSIILYVDECMKYVDIELANDCTDHTIDGMLRNKAISKFYFEKLSSDQNFNRPLRICCSSSASYIAIIHALNKMQSRGFIKFFVKYDTTKLFFKMLKSSNQCIHFMLSSTSLPSPYESNCQINRVINFKHLVACVCNQQTMRIKSKLRMLSIWLNMKSNQKEITEIGLAYNYNGINHQCLIQTIESSLLSRSANENSSRNVCKKFYDIIKVTNEKQLLQTFLQLFNKYDPDMLVGYSFVSEIIPTIDDRCRHKGIDNWCWSRLWIRYVPHKNYTYVTLPSIKLNPHSGRCVADMSVLGILYGSSSSSINERAATKKIEMLKRNHQNGYCVDIALTCLELFQTDYLIKFLTMANHLNTCVSKIYLKNA